MENQLKQRLIMGSIVIVLTALSIYYSDHPFFRPFFVVINAALISLAVLEYYKLVQHKGFHPLTWWGIGSTIVYVIASYFGMKYPSLETLPSFILLGSGILFFLTYFFRQNEPLSNLAVTLFAIAYLTIPLTFGLKINYFSGDGPIWLGYVLIVTKITDVGAYIFGSLMGKTKLAPFISPKKTVEGAVGGILFALLASFCFYFYFLPITIWETLWLGLVISILSQFGDLAESLLKRDAGVKDSNRLPGLGGILDLVDSLVFTLPLMYLLLQSHIFE